MKEARGRLLRRLAPLCVLGALLIMTTVTLAWLTAKEQTDAAYAALSDFTVEGKLLFGDAVYRQDQSILAPVSLTPGTNYIGEMEFQVIYTGVSPAYIRVRLLEEWTDAATGDVLSSGYLPYTLTGEAVNLLTGTDAVITGGAGDNKTDALADVGVWIDERPTDFCYYYSVPVRPRNLAATHGEAPPKQLQQVDDGVLRLTLLKQTPESVAELLQGVDADKVRLSLRFEVEAVQPNRFREFFGRETYPQPPSA